MKVHWTETAQGHLDAIFGYIAQDSSEYAKRMVDRPLRIIAVAHLHRRPGYWKERLEQYRSLKRDAAKSRRTP